jgi:hypothetical protein
MTLLSTVSALVLEATLAPDPKTDEFGRLYYKIPKLNDSGTSPENDEREPCTKAEANLICSEVKGDFWGSDTHFPVIDIDLPCRLIPSSTPGHFHLYIDSPIDGEKYRNMLDAMAEAGVVQEFYAKAAHLRGATFVRPTWVKKNEDNDE